MASPTKEEEEILERINDLEWGLENLDDADPDYLSHMNAIERELDYLHNLLPPVG